MSALITISVSSETMVVIEGERIRPSRLVWRASGLEVWVKGTMTDHQHLQARSLVMNLCEARHIPLISLRDVTVKPEKINRMKTDTRSMF